MHVIVAPVTSSRLLALLAGAWTACAACASFGTIAFGGGTRIGLLPLEAGRAAAALVATVVVIAVAWRLDRAARTAIAVTPLVFVLLPWLPFRVPAVFLIWNGGLASLAWIAAALGITAILRRRHVTWLLRARQTAVLAAAAAVIVFSAAAWLASPSLPSGDEPHYLVITQSLLYDGDLQIGSVACGETPGASAFQRR